MKIIYLLIGAFSLISHLLVAQFSNKTLLDTGYASDFCSVHAFSSFDWQNDGSDDVLVSYDCFPYSRLDLIVNGGQINQTKIQLIAQEDSILEISRAEMADLDLDGQQEIIVGATYSQTQGIADILIFKEVNPGVFQEYQRLTASDWVQELIIRDMDLDGFPDIVAREHVNIKVYYQDTSHQFSSTQIIVSGSEYYSLQSDFFFNAPRHDLLIGNQSFFFIENLGGRQYSVKSNFGVSLGFFSASDDFDNDGQPEIAAWETARGLIIFDHDGNGGVNVIDTVISGISVPSFEISDFNSDGQLDIVLPETQSRLIRLFQGSANGFDLTSNTLEFTGNSLVSNIAKADLNGDGLQDIIWGQGDLWYQINTTTVNSIVKEEKSFVKIFPNPANGKINIDNRYTEPIHYAIFDNLGKLILSDHLSAGEIKKASLLKKGLYHFKILHENDFTQMESRKILIR